MDDEPPLDGRVAAEPDTVQPKFDVKIKLGVQVRGSRMSDSPLYDQDIQAMHAIDSASFEPPWTPKEFKRALKHPHRLALLAEHEDKVVGFAVYELQRGRLEIVRLAVHPDYRRQGVGAQLVHKMLGKLTQQRRDAVVEQFIAEQAEQRQLGIVGKALHLVAAEPVADRHGRPVADGEDQQADGVSPAEDVHCGGSLLGSMSIVGPGGVTSFISRTP